MKVETSRQIPINYENLAVLPVDNTMYNLEALDVQPEIPVDVQQIKHRTYNKTPTNVQPEIPSLPRRSRAVAHFPQNFYYLFYYLYIIYL